MFEALLGMACALVAVTLVGHGLWVVAAAIFRNFDSANGQPAAKGLQNAYCPRCGLRMTASQAL